MSRTNWKQVEREAAALCGAVRFPANMGGRLDFEGAYFVGQVKNTKVMSLAALEKLVMEMSIIGDKRDKVGVSIVKRSAGAGRPTPFIVSMTGAQWLRLMPLLPAPMGGA